MDSLKIFYDRDNHILTIWFDDPQKEFIAQEVGEVLLVMQDRGGKTIGIERMNFVLADQNSLDVQLQGSVLNLWKHI
jgi:uncharacterized protein YuzE